VSEAFASMSALTVFLIIAGLGFVFLLLSLIFGEVFDHIGIDADAGGGVDGHGVIDSRVISVFITTFGGVGAIGIQLGLGVLASSLMGLASGVVLGGVVSLFARFLYRQQASSSVSAAQLVGRTAQVTVTIPAGGIGQISCRIGEERVEKIARSQEADDLRSGMLVRIEEIAGDSVIVRSAGDRPSFSPQTKV
jgi:membrane protein implicated in regulation of membrane protease activity